MALCYLTRCTDTENLKLGLVNAPYSIAFIDFCAVTFQNFLHTALGSPDAPPYVTPVSCTDFASNHAAVGTRSQISVSVP
jgi:hypothetical protein